MTTIIGFCGLAQSGKNTACNALFGFKMIENAFCECMKINDRGLLEVSDVLGERPKDLTDELFEFSNKNVKTDLLQEEVLTPVVKIYSFADKLKKFCIDLLELDEELVYGDNNQKNTPTHLLWEKMPGIVTEKNLFLTNTSKQKQYKDLIPHKWSKFLTYHRSGPMTVREVLQFVGTEIGRKIYTPIWVNSLIRQIKRDNSELALVSDVRFADEVDAVQQAGGFVVGLTRDIGLKLKHASERAPLKKCNAIVDNQDLTINESIAKIREVVKHLEGVAVK